MNIIGLNIFHADTSACLIMDNEIVAAAEEERFVRIKHYSGFPKKSIEYCLKEGNLKLSDIDYVCVNFNVNYNFFRKANFFLKNFLSINFFPRLSAISKRQDIKKLFFDNFSENISAKIINVPHHLSHIASAYLCSGFNKSLGLTFDGTGDFSCLELYDIKDDNFKIEKKISFPHSLGIFYQTITQYLGFKYYGEEYKVMGLAAYGNKKYIDEMYKLFKIKKNNSYELNLNYFEHHHKSFSYYFENGAPFFENFFNDKFEKLFNQKSRLSNEPIDQFHKDIAASAQHVFEEIIIILLRKKLKDSNYKNLCIAGGCAFNSLLMGKIKNEFTDLNVFVQPNSGDAGGAIGSALYTNMKFNENFKNNRFKNPYLGPSYSNKFIQDTIIDEIKSNNDVEKIYFEEFDKLTEYVATRILKNDVVGWFQGRMEWGPRALGNRSIIANPKTPNMKDIINSKIKKREEFRPFAPSILDTKVDDYFEGSSNNLDYMSYVVRAKNQNIYKEIPAVVHSDGTSRVQVVRKHINKKFYKLIESFYKISGVPLVLNTSLNVNEPMCESPKQALNVFTSSSMDVIVLENYVLIKK
jgi:carbamoyltransferase